MKTVFNNQQLAHVWASQSQSSGRNASKTMFFQGNTIYSYGYHYAMAKIYQTNKGKIILVNEHQYSNTTGKQRRDVINSIKGTEYLMVPDVTELNSEKNETYLFNELIKSIDDALNTRKLYGSMDYVDNALEDLNTYLSFNDRPVVTLDPIYYASMTEIKYIKEAKKAEKDRIRSFKRRMAAEKYEADQRAMKIEQSGLIDLWLDGVDIDKHINWYLFKKEYPNDLIRLKPGNNSIVETNRGAEVPLNEARQLLQAFLNGQAKIGDKVGHFTVDALPDSRNVVKIGCHNVNLEQAKQALKLGC